VVGELEKVGNPTNYRTHLQFDLHALVPYP